MTINQRVKNIRKLLKLSQFELAESLGVTQGAISQLEVLGGNPSYEVLKGLHEKYFINLNYLISGTEEAFFGKNASLNALLNASPNDITQLEEPKAVYKIKPQTAQEFIRVIGELTTSLQKLNERIETLEEKSK